MMKKLTLNKQILLVVLAILAVVVLGLIVAYINNPQLVGHNFFSLPVRSDSNWHGAFGGWL